MGRQAVPLEFSVFTLAWLSGRAALNSKSFTDPHHVLCIVVSSKPPSLPFQVRFQTCHLIFPWHRATGTILVSSRVLGTNNSTLLHTVLASFSKVNLGLGPSETLTPLRGENLNVHERHVRVLSVVNNKQNRHIPAAYKQAWPCWMSEVPPWRLHLYVSAGLFLCVTSCH